jgi:FkbM family methyltransferase
VRQSESEREGAGARVPLDHPLRLGNGLTCYLASRKMLLGARYIAWEVFQKRRYFRAGYELRPGDTVVDIGANFGLFVLWAAPQVQPGRVIAIEPQPDALRCLHTNIEANGLTNVTVVEEAVGAPDSALKLASYTGSEGLSHDASYRQPWFARSLMALGKYPRTVTSVRQQSLGQVMSEHAITHIDFLKVDCEGGEYDILRNVTKEDLACIDRIAIEYHEFSKGQRHRDLVRILEGAGFEVEHRAPLLERLLGRTGEIWALRP